MIKNRSEPRRNIAHDIASQMRRDIISGIFKPGEALAEPALAGRFGVSRAPVREALRILERDHLARLSARRGATVTAPDADTRLAQTGRRFLDEILAVGGSRPAIDSFRAFRGRDPRLDALLRHNGMVEESAREPSNA